jgi:hypothetical protein
VIQHTRILATDLSEAELVDAIARAVADSVGHGGQPLMYRHTEDMSDDEVVHHWIGPTDAHVLRVIEDGPMQCRYAVVGAPSPSEADILLASLAAVVGFIACEEVVVRARSALPQHPARLLQLTVCDSKRHNPSSETLLLECSLSATTEVRMAAVQAMGMLAWPKLVERLRDMERDEGDFRIADVIDFALRAHERR